MEDGVGMVAADNEIENDEPLLTEGRDGKLDVDAGSEILVVEVCDNIASTCN